MVKIGTVWDRTAEVLGGRTSILAGIAILLMLLPQVIHAGVAALAAPQTLLAVLASVLSLVVLVCAVWGSLAITAVAISPAMTRDEAIRVGWRRLPAGMGVIVLVGLVSVLLALPGTYLLGSAGFDWQRASARLPQTDLDPSRGMLAVLYFLVLVGVAMWFGARMLPLMAVIVNERLGLRAIARSFALTRGSTLKLIGVMILYAIVLLVVMAAASLVTGLLLQLVLGRDSVAGINFGVAVASAIVTTVFNAILYVFGAQVYVAASGTNGSNEASTRP